MKAGVSQRRSNDSHYSAWYSGIRIQYLYTSGEQDCDSEKKKGKKRGMDSRSRCILVDFCVDRIWHRVSILSYRTEFIGWPWCWPTCLLMMGVPALLMWHDPEQEGSGRQQTQNSWMNRLFLLSNKSNTETESRALKLEQKLIEFFFTIVLRSMAICLCVFSLYANDLFLTFSLRISKLYSYFSFF